jgi:hypothetical protein
MYGKLLHLMIEITQLASKSYKPNYYMHGNENLHYSLEFRVSVGLGIWIRSQLLCFFIESYLACFQWSALTRFNFKTHARFTLDTG